MLSEKTLNPEDGGNADKIYNIATIDRLSELFPSFDMTQVLSRKKVIRTPITFLRLSENVSDQGAGKCVTEVASRLENPDYQKLYRSMANA